MSSFIHDLEITNFKSIRHQRIEGCKRINVFIGYPNVGKSNILEAIGSAGLFHLVDVKPKFSVKDFVRVESASELLFEGDSSRPAILKFNLYTNFWFNYNKQLGRLAALIRYPIISDTYLSARLEFNQDFTVERESLKKLILEKQDLRNGFGGNKEGNLTIKKYSFKTDIEPDNDYTGSLILPFGENLMRVLNEDAHLRKEVSELFEKYNLKLALDKTSGTIKVVKDYNDGTIFLLPYSLVADTLQRLIFYKAAIASNENTVLLFEEPEAHMFPPYIKLFTNDIVDKKSNQYFINTHSPFVLNELMEHGRGELSVFTVGLNNGETTIRRLTDEELEEVHQYGVDLFFNLESYL